MATAIGCEFGLPMFDRIVSAAQKVADRLGVSVEAEDGHTQRPLREDGMDPVLNLGFTHPDGRKFSVLAIAYCYDHRGSLTMVPDGDVECDDAEGFEPHPWRGAVLEELAVELRAFPKASQRLCNNAEAVFLASVVADADQEFAIRRRYA